MQESEEGNMDYFAGIIEYEGYTARIDYVCEDFCYMGRVYICCDEFTFTGDTMEEMQEILEDIVKKAQMEDPVFNGYVTHRFIGEV